MTREDERERTLREQRLGRISPTEKWIDLHFVSTALMLAGMIVNGVILLFLMSAPEDLPSDTVWRVARYVFVPALSGYLLLTVAFAVRWRSTNERAMMFTASVVCSLVFMVGYMTYSRFPAIDPLLLLPIVATVGYANMTLTNVTAGLTFAMKLLADVWLIGALPGTVPKGDSSPFHVLNFLLSCGMMLLCWLVVALFIVAERGKMEEALRQERTRRRLFKQAVTDDMTGVGNRAALRDAFNCMVADAAKGGYCVAMVDIDRFKSVNDTFGHGVGDLCIQGLADILRLARDAEVFRLGGDEFCVLFFNHTKEKAALVCEHLGERFGELEIAGGRRRATASFGVAEWDGRMPPSELVRRADDALYEAKQQRGCVRIHGE